MKRVLVTGAAGFIGSHVADHCLSSGLEVVGVDDLSGGLRANVGAGVEFLQGTVQDPNFVSSVFDRGPFAYVYHLAAYAAEGLSHFVRRFNYDNNLLGSVNLINESVLHGVECFVFTSSIAVYGHGQTPMSEDMTPLPEDPYGIAKYAVELDLAAAYRMFGMDYVIFRPHNVYGERQNIADRYRNVIGIFMNQLMHGESMTIFGDGRQTRAFSHVDDVAPIIAHSPDVGAARREVFNVGADQPYAVVDLAKRVGHALDLPSTVTHLAARQEVVHAFASHEKVQRVFRPPSPVDLDAGLERMARWAKMQGSVEPSRFQGIEIERNLPSSWKAHGPIGRE